MYIYTYICICICICIIYICVLLLSFRLPLLQLVRFFPTSVCHCPNREPGTAAVCGMNGVRNMHVCMYVCISRVIGN